MSNIFSNPKISKNIQNRIEKIKKNKIKIDFFGTNL